MKKRLIAIFASIILLTAIGISYAYFTGMIFGESKKITVVAKTLRIVFIDDQELTNSEITPGWSETKTFSVKNESNEIFNYNIVFENLVNTFVTEGFLQYKITSTNGYNMDNYQNIPKSENPTDVVLAFDIDIIPEETHEYTIEFIYHNSEKIDQSSDMGKKLTGNLAITEGSVNPNIKYTVMMLSENSVISPNQNETLKKGNLEFEITPNIGYDINNINVSCNPNADITIKDNIIKVNNIIQNHTCNVSLNKKKYMVNVNSNDPLKGTILPTSQLVNHAEDAQVELSAAKYHYYLNNTCNGTLNGNILTIPNITDNKTCEVSFYRPSYTVNTVVSGGTSNPSSTSVSEGNSATFTISASSGHTTSGATVSGEGCSLSGNILTVSNVTKNVTCNVKLKSTSTTVYCTSDDISAAKSKCRQRCTDQGGKGVNESNWSCITLDDGRGTCHVQCIL